jgi:UDP-glucose 4-epimerase
MRVLVAGVAGTVAQRLAVRLLREGHEVVGLDAREVQGAPKDLEVIRADLRKRPAEDVFRKRRPEAVVHMATVTSLAVAGEERERINLGGTQAVFEYCKRYGVKQCLFVGRHTYYGAASDAPLLHTEDEPPRALDAFPQLADLVAADLYAATALWRLPQLTTCVLRLCYTLGTPGAGTLSQFLAGRRVPLVLGYDPLFQVLHEEDAVEALALALKKKLRGIFNVAGPQPLPLSRVVQETGRTPIPLPEPLLRLLIGRAGLPRLPSGALEHLKFPVVTDASAFREATGFSPRYDEVQTLHRFRDVSALR